MLFHLSFFNQHYSLYATHATVAGCDNGSVK